MAPTQASDWRRVRGTSGKRWTVLPASRHAGPWASSERWKLELSHENARALAHLFESLQVQRLVVGELDDPDTRSEQRDRGSRNGRLPGPGSA